MGDAVPLYQLDTFRLNTMPLVCVRIVFQHIISDHFPVFDIL